MQNLLSQQQKIDLKNGYKNRLIITFSWMIFFAFFLSIIIFFPVYFMASIKTEDAEVKVQVNQGLIKEQEETLLIPKQINDRASLVLSFKSLNGVSEQISAIVDKTLSGISLSGISLPAANKILISGTAKTRDTLLSFDKKLKEIDFIKSTEVPVASFAKDSDLPFTITLNLKS